MVSKGYETMIANAKAVAKKLEQIHQDHLQFNTSVANCQSLAEDIQEKASQIPMGEDGGDESNTTTSQTLAELEALLANNIIEMQEILEKANHALGTAENLKNRVASNTAQQVKRTETLFYVGMYFSLFSLYCTKLNRVEMGIYVYTSVFK